MTYSHGSAILSGRMKSEKISELTTSRLSVYLRCLNALHSAGIKTISSQALAEQFNLNSAQIRKDLGYFGEFGVRGVGYYVDDLREHITKILGLDTPHRVGIVGAGRLGTALANYNGFDKSNFTVVALFDNDRQKIGRRIGDAKLLVHDVDQLSNIIRAEAIDVLFRMAHSIKGMAASLDHHDIAETAHRFEDRMQEIRAAGGVVGAELPVLFREFEGLEALVAQVRQAGPGAGADQKKKS